MRDRQTDRDRDSQRNLSVAEPISESTPQINFSLMRASSDNQRQ